MQTGSKVNREKSKKSKIIPQANEPPIRWPYLFIGIAPNIFKGSELTDTSVSW